MERHACSDVRKYATALTDMVLLGNLAQRTGRPIEWDAEQAQTNAMEVAVLIRPLYRPTWQFSGAGA